MELPKRKKNRLTGYDYSQNGGVFCYDMRCGKTRTAVEWARTARPRDTAPLSQYGLVVDAAILRFRNIILVFGSINIALCRIISI